MSALPPYSTDERIRATYHLTCPPAETEARAEATAREQTVEVPVALTVPPFAPQSVHDRVLGRVVSIEPLDDPTGDEHAGPAAALHPLPTGHARFVATIDYAAELASGTLPQLLNLLYGNISMLQGIRLVDAELPASLLDRFGGPTFGEAGLRAMVGVHGRPLLATAIKPRGAPIERFAEIARDFALGGGDLIKDDHNLAHGSADADFSAFVERVGAIQLGVQEANEKTGRRCLYLPLVSGPHDAMRRQLDAAAAAGCAGVLVCALTQGLDAVREIADRKDLLAMTHPTFAGGFFTTPRHGITPAFLLGTLFRLAGADCSVFPHAGGRFGFSKAECAELAEHLARPMGSAGRAYAAALPAPAGGMTLERVPEMAAMYGEASVLLVGGGLLSLRESLVDGTRVFADAIGEAFAGATTTEPAAGTFASSCEAPGGAARSSDVGLADATDGAAVTHLPFDADRFVWRGREPIAYKPADASEATPFRDVVRHELFGKQGEPAAFDLRYFEIAPGGYSSLEKHRHVHAIVVVRGRGVLTVEGATHELGPMDLAYVPPMAAHQLAPADEGESFGFLCVVDRDRDRPQPA